MATMRRLSDGDVRAIFESLHGSAQPPPHLKFQIVPVGPNGLKLSPPSYEFEDGLYVLLKPEKRKKKPNTPLSDVADSPKVPTHLSHLKIKSLPPEVCPWSLSGPQFPQPTAIQQRYCYPKGNAEYSSRKGGALWTMYGRDGREDLEFRLLHVYFSAKRAVNKGMSISDDERRVVEQQLLESTPKKRRKYAASESRIVLSPWQQQNREGARQDLQQQQQQQSSPMSSSVASSSCSSISTRRGGHASAPILGPPTRMKKRKCDSPSLFDIPEILPPMSPCSDKSRMTKKSLPTPGSVHKNESKGSIFVSPHTTASQSSRRFHDDDEDNFSGRNFHPIHSFDEKDKPSVLSHSLQHNGGRYQFHDVFRDLQEGSENTSIAMDGYRRRKDPGDKEHCNVGSSFDCNEIDMLDLNDPFLATIVMKPSMEHVQEKLVPPGQQQEDPYVALGDRLNKMQRVIREGILSQPSSEQGAMVSIVANWAKELAKSPLLPKQGNVKKEGDTPSDRSLDKDISGFAAV